MLNCKLFTFGESRTVEIKIVGFGPIDFPSQLGVGVVFFRYFRIFESSFIGDDKRSKAKREKTEKRREEKRSEAKREKT